MCINYNQVVNLYKINLGFRKGRQSGNVEINALKNYQALKNDTDLQSVRRCTYTMQIM